MPASKPAEDRDFQSGFAKGLEIIAAFDHAHSKMTIAEAARITGLPRASARRFLHTLAKLGYAEFDGKFFQLTPRVLRLGYAYLWSTTVPQVLQPYVERLSQSTNESCSASTLDGSDIVYIARSAQRRVMSIGLSVGTRVPAVFASMGRVLLAHLPDDQLDRMLEALPQPLTRCSTTDPAELRAIIERVRQDGYAVVNQEIDLGLRSIAVPIYNVRGKAVAAMNFSLQVERYSMEEMVETFLPRLREVQNALRDLLP